VSHCSVFVVAFGLAFDTLLFPPKVVIMADNYFSRFVIRCSKVGSVDSTVVFGLSVYGDNL
jgi:hypothetical protein